MATNIDPSTARAFNQNWGADTSGAETDPAIREAIFANYFALLPLDELSDKEGFDLGCGGGRHARMVAPRVGHLHCIDPSANGIARTRRGLAKRSNVSFHVADVDHIPLADGSQDFGYSMGVLHHIPDTSAALRRCTAKLKPGAPFLLYLYYAFDNRPVWFGWLWKASELGRHTIARLPFRARKACCDLIGLLVYWPLSRLALVLESIGRNVSGLPLSFYRRLPLETLRWAALDRFGTALEQRFTRAEMTAMMTEAGLVDIRFNETEPYWVAIGRKA